MIVKIITEIGMIDELYKHLKTDKHTYSTIYWLIYMFTKYFLFWLVRSWKLIELQRWKYQQIG